MDASILEEMNHLLKRAYEIGFDKLNGQERDSLLHYPGFDMAHYLRHSKEGKGSQLREALVYVRGAEEALRYAAEALEEIDGRTDV